MFDLQTGDLFAVSSGDAQVFDIAFSPDSALLAINYGNNICSITSGYVEVWDIARRTRRGTLLVHTFGTRTSDILFSPDGARLILNASPVPARRDSFVHFWNTDNYFERASLHFQEGVITQLAVSPNGALLAIADDNGGVHLFDLTRGLLADYVSAQTQTLRDMAFSPNSNLLATVDEEGRARVWLVE